MFPYRAVVFDLDGTLFDAEEGILSSIRYAMETLGYSCPPNEEIRCLIGPPLRDSFRGVLGVAEKDVEEAVRAYGEYFHETGIKHYRVYPGIRRLLYTLRKNGIYTAVATSKPQALAEYNLRLYHLSGLFNKVVGEVENAEKMGKAALIRGALTDIATDSCVMVGDRRFDLEGAEAAGIDSIAAGYGYGSEQELQSATHYVSTVNELHTLLCGEENETLGYFLSLEGPDGSGKTTQLNRLKDWLLSLDYDVYLTREPGGSPIGEKIREILLDINNSEMCPECEALLYAASRAQHVREVIRPKVDEGKLVLCDRFVDSSIAYQGGGRSLGVKMVRSINAPAVDGFLPDATVYLSIDRKEALKRRYASSTPDRLESEGLDFHTRVQKAYEEQILLEPERFLVVNAALSADEVTEQIHQKLLERLP